jgi:protoporphyrinogen oxidase
VVVGAGPAGLSAAHELTKLGLCPLVVERSDAVGGLASTSTYRGYHFDMGGHRFFTKVDEIKKFWQDMLGQDLLLRPRLSRIYYRRRFFFYPLRPLDVLLTIGPWEAARIALSYVRWQLFPDPREDTFEQWVTNRFGRRLFQTFFKAYTEKIWGIPCNELRAEWAAQRIKGLSLASAVLGMFVKPKTRIKTLIEEFHYPRLGPGMMWNAVRAEVERRGGTVRLSCGVRRVERTAHRIDAVVVDAGGHEEVVRGSDFIVSMPLREFLERLTPPPPPAVLEAATSLRYRDFVTVGLIVDQSHLFADNWIYVHDADVRVGRIQNFKNWSPDMVPDPAKTSLGLEYFCNAGDSLWNTPDPELIEIARREIARIGIARYEAIEDGCVFRVRHAYPVYDSQYGDALQLIRRFVDGLENLHLVGRNGLHRYNNQDHAMLTGMLAARRVALGERHDLWSVNTEPEYHEEIQDPALPRDVLTAGEWVPTGLFSRLHQTALGLSIGVTAGIALFLATVWVLLKGGFRVGPNLGLLGQFMPGYAVTPTGCVLGLLYGFSGGFTAGWMFAFARNAIVSLYARAIRRRLEMRAARGWIE